MHGNRARPSAQRLAELERERIVQLMANTYADFNHIHMTEKLREVVARHLAGVAAGQDASVPHSRSIRPLACGPLAAMKGFVGDAAHGV